MVNALRRWQTANVLCCTWAFSATVWLSAVCQGDETPCETSTFERWGAETLSSIRRDLFIDSRGLYAEKARTDRRRSTVPAFNWGAGVQLSALAAAARVSPAEYQTQLVDYADALQQHWVHEDGIGGYDVLPKPRAVDRYYDDNAWMVLALVETFDITGEQRFLDRAVEAMRFVLSGEDDRLGGGIYWREKRKHSKNACSNAPVIVAALELFKRTDDKEYLATAHRLYQWTTANLQDDTDGLFWDNVRLDGRIDRRKYSYNSALMIRANCSFYQISAEEKYLREAERLAESARRHWMVPKTGAVKDVGRFAHMLLEALMAVAECNDDNSLVDGICQSLHFVHDQVQDPDGRYPRRWDRATTEPLASYMLLDQASAARAYFFAAHALSRQQQSRSESGGDSN